MKVNWDHPKSIASTGQAIPAGEPFEMPDDEALARLAAGEIGLNAHDPEELRSLLARKNDQEPALEVVEPEMTGETPGGPEAVSVAPRARRRASEPTVSETGAEG